MKSNLLHMQNDILARMLCYTCTFVESVCMCNCAWGCACISSCRNSSALKLGSQLSKLYNKIIPCVANVVLFLIVQYLHSFCVSYIVFHWTFCRLTGMTMFLHENITGTSRTRLLVDMKRTISLS